MLRAFNIVTGQCAFIYNTVKRKSVNLNVPTTSDKVHLVKKDDH